MKHLAIILLSVFLFTNCSSDKEKTTHLTGKVIDRDSKTLILAKQTQDIRYSGVEIPIDSLGNFNYDMSFQFVEAYELIFKDDYINGAWRPILFFPDNDTIKFTLFPLEKPFSNKIEGSTLSLKKEMINELLKNSDNIKRYWHLKQISDSLSRLNDSSDYLKAIIDSCEILLDQSYKYKFQLIKEEQNIFGYHQLLEMLKDQKKHYVYELDSLKEACSLFEQNFPNHPYNELAQIRLDGLLQIKVGGEYVDFAFQDSIGNTLRLSDIISKNRFTLLDLWAPWCGPCIRKSQKILPVYEELKEKGFVVVGVIGGISTEEQYVKTVQKYKYPWLLTAEINDENKLWEKYCVSGGGGGQFLMDNKGKIIAINPSLEDIKRILPEE